MNKLKIYIKKNNGFLFILPMLMVFILFLFVPIIKAFVLSLEADNLSEKFIGFENYSELLKDRIFIKGIINTVLFVVITVPMVVILALLISTQVSKMKNTWLSYYRAAFYLPAVTSIVTVSIVWRFIYNPRGGILNFFVGLLNIEPINWLGNPNTALLSLAIIVVTIMIGQPVVLYIAAINNVPVTYYEAADIEGAKKWQQFIHVTWPLCLPTSLYIIVISTIQAFQVFAVVQLMTRGGPYYKTTTIVYQLYETAFIYGKYGRAATMGIFLLLIVLVISIGQFKFLSTDIEY